MASAQLYLSPTQYLAGDAAIGAATGDQTTPRAARGASTTLVVWADRRGSLSTNSGATASHESGLDVYATRLDAAGAPMEATPIPVGVLGADQTSPNVAWNGQNWLVTWISQVPAGSWYTQAIQGVRVSPLGEVLDAQPIPLLQFASSGVNSNLVASNGSDWVIVAQGDAVAGLWASRLSAGGTVLDPTPVLIDPLASLPAGLAISGAQGVYLLAWANTAGSNGWDIKGRRFDSALQVLDASPFTIASTVMNDVFPSVASNGTQFLVAFERYVTTTGQSDIRAARVTPQGAVLDPTPIELTGNLPYGNSMRTAVTWDGALWYLSWAYAGLNVARVDAGGSVLDFGGFPLNPQHSGMSQGVLAGAAGGGTQVVWVDSSAGSYEGLDLVGSIVVDASTQSSPVLLSRGASAQLDLDIAQGGAGYLTVFRSETSGNRRILASRLGPQGQSLDSEPIEIAQGLFEQNPAVAWDGSRFLIVWERFGPVSGSNTIWARRMAPDGTLLDAPFQVLSGLQPEVAALNGNFLVVGTRYQSVGQLSFPVGVRVRGSDGAVLGTPFTINSTFAQVPDVCVLGNRWAVVWQRNVSHDNPWADVAGAFVEETGSPSGSFYVGDPSSAYNYAPRVHSKGDQALVVWTGNPSTSLARRVLARRLLPDGTSPDSVGFAVASAAPGQRFAPAVAWTGNDYVVAFQDQRAVVAPLIDSRSDVYAARVSTNGVVLDPSGFAIESSVDPETRPALASDVAGNALIGSSSFRREIGLGSFRAGVRSLFGGCPTPTTYCTALVSSSGCTPSMGSSGSPSLTIPGTFSVQASNLEVGKSGLLFFGTSGPASLPFYGGTLCVASTIYRLPAKSTGGAASCSGALSYSLIDYLNTAAPLFVGTKVYSQVWFRDPSAPQTVGLSDALEMTICL